MSRIVVTDLDNTLYDWVAFYVPAFRAMLHQLSEDTDTDPAVLCRDFREVHQRHGTVEYSFSVEELPSLVHKYGGAVPRVIVQRCAERFREVRRRSLRLYPDVEATLAHLRDSEVAVVAYTEANSFHALDRLQALGILDLISSVYATADHGVPRGRSRTTRFGSSKLEVHEVNPSLRKPDPSVLHAISRDLGVPMTDILYVGDSLSKDVLMAQRAGAVDVWARYGVAHGSDDYALLVAISHWTPAMVARERELQALQVSPRYVIDRFSEIARIVARSRDTFFRESEFAAGK